MFIKTLILIIFLTVRLSKCVEELFCNTTTGENCECVTEPCFRKCCKLGEYYGNDDECSSDYEGMSKSEIINVTLLNGTGHERNYGISDINTLIYGLLPCDVDYILAYKKRKKFKLYVNGSISILHESRIEKFDPVEYCSDFSPENGKVFVLRCFLSAPELQEGTYYSAFCIFISLPLLIITEAVFFFVETQNNGLAGKIIMTQIFSLIMGYGSLALVRFYEFQSVPCIILGYAVHFFLMSICFWLNAMCFDIWMVFSSRSLPNRNTPRHEDLQKYYKYAAYSWGVPLIICLITFISSIILPRKSPFNPSVEDFDCLMTKSYPRAIFYFFPLTVLLILNVSMFGGTAYNIYLHKKEMNVLNSAGSNIANNAREKERLNLYFKLFLVMGITWVAEPLSVAFNEEPKWLWTTFDSINLLQGVPIFIIFVCKERNLTAIRNSVRKYSRDISSAFRKESSSSNTKRTNSKNPSTTFVNNRNSSVSITYSNSSTNRSPTIRINSTSSAN